MYATLLWTSQGFQKICKPLVVIILMHDVISLPEATLYDNKLYTSPLKLMVRIINKVAGMFSRRILKITKMNLIPKPWLPGGVGLLQLRKLLKNLFL